MKTRIKDEMKNKNKNFYKVWQVERRQVNGIL